MKIKTVLKWASIPLLLVGTYLVILQTWMWYWQTPRHQLPASHLTLQEVFRSDESGIGKNAQQQLASLAQELQSVSISGAMSVGGELVWAGTAGLAKIEPKTPADLNTQYRIGSVSKSVTAVALMRMVEEGMIDLDVPISKYLPNHPHDAGQITTRQLLSHTAGVRHYQFEPLKFPPTDGFSNVAFEDSIAALSQFSDDPLLFQPGEDFAYSTHGYTLLSAVMQAAGGKKFEQLVAELVTEPLGLSSTAAEHLLSETSALAGFYNSDGGLYSDTPVQNLSNKVAGGGFVSTPSELVRLGASLLENSLLSAASFSEMTAVQLMPDGEENPQSYALGWRHYETRHIVDENHMVDIIHHGGVSVGANAFFMLVPKYDISVAIMTNGKGEKSRGEIQRLAYRLAGLVVKPQLIVAEVAKTESGN